jgi:hypothetical protein
VDSSRSNQGSKGHRGAAQRGSRVDPSAAGRNHATHGVQLSRQADSSGQYQGLVPSAERAGIENFRWHDFRHTWASWHVQNGTPLFALQQLGGWDSAEMVRRYAHLSADHLTPYADRLCALRVEDPAGSTFTAQATNEKELAVANSFERPETLPKRCCASARIYPILMRLGTR